MEKIRLGIIGIGNMGTGHASNVVKGSCPDFLLSAIADNNPERLIWAKEKFGEEVKYFDTAEKMIKSGLIDAAIVAVPHYDHASLAIMCIENGIHVMVEKPAGVYTKQAREMNEVAEQHPDVVFGMMFNQRTNCLYRKLRELVQSGNYGRIRRTNWIITNWYRPQAYYNSGGWRATWAGEGGGVLLNQCPHQLDLWQWICGMPKKVQAHLHFGKWHDIEVEDDVTAYVEYENGATGVFVTTTGDGRGSNRLEIQMDKAKFVVEDGKLILDEFEMSEPEFSATNTEVFGSLKVDHMSEYINLHCPKLALYDDKMSYGEYLKYTPEKTFWQRMDDLIARGDRMWTYICNAPIKPYGALFADYPGTWQRPIFWQTYERSATGFLYWSCNAWDYHGHKIDPWEDLWNSCKGLNPGEEPVPVYAEGILCYPGMKVGIDGPVSSIRLKIFRDGIEDYELFVIAEKLLGREFVIKKINEVTPSLTEFSSDIDKIALVRKEIGEAIEKAM